MIWVDPELAAALSGAILVAFVVLLLIAMVLTNGRARRFRRARQHVPVVLKRDAIWLTSWGILFSMLLVARLLGLMLGTDVIWVAVTGAMGLTGIVAYVYVEVRGIEREDRPPKGGTR